MSEGHGVAKSLLRYEEPVRRVQWFIVECLCGWKSQRTSNWHASLDGHFYREERKAAAALHNPQETNQ